METTLHGIATRRSFIKKRFALLAGVFLAVTIQTQAQTKIGGSGAPDNSAMLEVTGGPGNNKGILPPRLTTAQRDGITLPATGLMIYNTTANQLQVNVGTPAAPIWTVPIANNAWLLTGNAGINPATYFIGTTDAQPLIARTNNLERLRLTPTGSMGLGTSSPAGKLHLFSNTPEIGLLIDAMAVGGTAIPLWIRTQTTSSNSGVTMRISSNQTGNTGTLDLGILNGAASLQSVNVGNTPGNIALNSVGGSVGIGTTAPAQKLDVVGTARISGSAGTATGVVGRNAAGDISNLILGAGLSIAGGTLNTTAAAGWALAGNAGTNPATQFVGTTDAQPLILRTNNTEKVRVGTNGYVGISDATPLAPLSFPSTLGPKIRLWDDGTDNETYGIGLSSASLNYHVDRNVSAVHRFFAGGSNGDGTELMRIQGNGNVGVGTATPAAKLDVNGTARISGSAGTASAIVGRNATGDISNITLGSNLSLTGGVLNATVPASGWSLTGNAGTNPATNFIGTTDAQPLIFRTNSTEYLRIASTGNVGIFDATPLAPLSFASTAGPKIRFYDDGTDNLTYGIGITSASLNYHIESNAVAAHRFFAGGSNGDGTELMRVQGDGNVGIGVATAAAKLDVNGTARISGSAGTPAAIMGRDASGSIGNIALGANLSLANGVLSASGGGTTGWGLTGNAGTNPATNFIGTTDAQPLWFRTNNNNQLVLNQNGFLGLNTATPSARLTIVNNAIGESDDMAIYRYETGGTTRISFFAAGGTQAAPANLTNNQFLSSFIMHGYVGGQFRQLNAIRNLYKGNGSTVLSEMRFITSGNLAILIDENQNVAIGGGVVNPTQRLQVDGNVLADNFIVSSDKRLKENIVDMSQGLQDILKLRPVTYSLKKDATRAVQFGFIAQEVDKVMPQVVVKPKSADKFYSVNYTELIPVLTKAIQEQQAQIDALKAENQKSQAQIDALNSENQKLKVSSTVTAELMERVKKMEQMLAIKANERSSTVAAK